MTRPTRQPTSGIDDGSSLAEITDAFGRNGIQLAFRPVESGWEAVISAQGVKTFERSGPTRLAAARHAWHDYLERNDGIGQS